MKLRFSAIAYSAYLLSTLHSHSAYTPRKAGALENFDQRAVQRRNPREAANEQGAAFYPSTSRGRKQGKGQSGAVGCQARHFGAGGDLTQGAAGCATNGILFAASW
jgi:hypothetical protein